MIILTVFSRQFSILKMYLLSWAVTHWKLDPALVISGRCFFCPRGITVNFGNCLSLNSKADPANSLYPSHRLGGFAGRFIYQLLNEVIFNYFWECYCGIMSWHATFPPGAIVPASTLLRWPLGEPECRDQSRTVVLGDEHHLLAGWIYYCSLSLSFPDVQC